MLVSDVLSVPPLETGTLLAAAKAETGLGDWGDDSLPERFGLVVDHLRKQGMDAAAEAEASKICMWLLKSRLQLFEDRKLYPIADEKIDAPLFATGEPRSGTTLLHALLSADPHAQALRFWEVMYPSPPPGIAAPDDQRRARNDDDWREINAQIPKWMKSHPYNDMLGDGLPEDERAWGMDFRALTPTGWWRVPMPSTIAAFPLDFTAQYAFHKMMLQQFQYGRPKKYWVLKGFHGGRLKQLFDTYPDAHIIWTHRDPVPVIASSIQLLGEITEGITRRPYDWVTAAKNQLAYSRANYKALLENPLVNDPRIFHVPYQDFHADAVGTIRRFYEFAGKPFGADTEAAMRGYLATNKGDRYGRFEYSLDVIGEDIDALYDEFAPYRERFGIAVEKKKR